jgi:phenylalanyl-tRNA synthetase beta subunit
VQQRTITFDFGRTKALGGIDVAEQRQREILESLGFGVAGSTITIPTWRRDVEGPADLVEEIARITGYENVRRRHSTAPRASPIPRQPVRSSSSGESAARPRRGGSTKP